MASAILDNQLEPWSKLEGKIVMVTGASSGLGLEFCLDLAKAGCRIVAAARRVDRLESLCQQINQMATAAGGGSRQAIAVQLDVTADGKAIEASVQKAWDEFGCIDALINNAGVRGKQFLLSLSPLSLSIHYIYTWTEISIYADFDMEISSSGTMIFGSVVSHFYENFQIGIGKVSIINKIENSHFQSDFNYKK